MPLILIEGHYEILQTEPDGDSIKFYPKSKNDWALLKGGGHSVKFNANGGAQLRLDAIDALETHYTPRVGGLGITHQPQQLADGAAAEALKWLGFHDVQRAGQKVTSAQPAKVPGYILSRFSDKYGRPVAFAFKGNRDGKTGDQILFKTDELKKSLNYHMLAAGQAYPTYYSKLFVDIRKELTKVVEAARTEKKGVWAGDKTTGGFKVSSVAQVQDEAIIMPKLFRRLVDYIANNADDTSLSGFKEYLAANDDRVFILPDGQSTGFDFVVDVQGQTVRLTTPIENLVFLEK